MAKSQLKLQAIQLRRKGISVNKIASQLEISKSTASFWVRDIILSIDQLEKLRNNSIQGRLRGSLAGALKQKTARLNLIESEKRRGLAVFQNLSPREFLIAGLAIYVSEGNKKTREVRLCNSDPQIILFMLNWFKNCFNLTNDDFRCCVGINEAHREREHIVKKYWQEITGLPEEHFRKTSFKKSKLRKSYENFNEHFGTLDITVLQSARIYYRILGQIHGLLAAGSRPESRGVS